MQSTYYKFIRVFVGDPQNKGIPEFKLLKKENFTKRGNFSQSSQRKEICE